MLNEFEILVLAAALIVICGFVVGRRRLVWFIAAIVIALAAIPIGVVFDPEGTDVASMLLAWVGIGCLAVGLGGVRIMAHRSVSLDMLERIASGAETELANSPVFEGRLQDLDHYGVAFEDQGRWSLTAFGRFLEGFFCRIRKLLGWPL